MGISIREFRIAMEVFGAKRLPDREGSRYSKLVPCFDVKGVEFLHSGSYYVVPRGERPTKAIMEQAMAECGEKHPGGSNFWWSEIHSIRGILTLAAILDGKFSKEFVDELTSETYKKVLDCRLIQSNEELPFKGTQSEKLQQLSKTLEEYNNTVNLFASYKLKQPIEYLDKIDVGFSAEDEGDNQYANLTLEGKSTQINFVTGVTGWCYSSYIMIQQERKNACLELEHYYDNGSNGDTVDEVIHVHCDFIKKRNQLFKKPLDDIDFQISLKTGLAWKQYEEFFGRPATDEQIDLAIYYIKKSIKRIQKNIIRYMIDQNA